MMPQPFIVPQTKNTTTTMDVVSCGAGLQRRIMAGWVAFAKHWGIFKSNLAIGLKRQVYNSCVLPAMTYGADTWTLTKQAQNKLAAAQTKMERSMLNITYKDRKTNIWRPYNKKRRQGDMPRGGETTWTNTGATRCVRRQHKTG